MAPLQRPTLGFIIAAFSLALAAVQPAGAASRCAAQCGAAKRDCVGQVNARLKTTLGACGATSDPRRCRRAARQAAEKEREGCGSFRRDCRTCCRGGGGDTCQQRCGDLLVSVERGEQCDPPLSTCSTGALCNVSCQCPAPVCGNGRAEAGETCGEPGLDCAPGVACVDCGCGARTTVPSVVGLDLDGARTTLAAAGLVPGQITKSVQVAIPAVGVLTQSPAAGAGTRAGTAVDLTVTYPPDAGDFLAFDVPSVETSASALAYYAAVDPLGEKTTLAAWKAANRFGTPGGIEASAIYFNDNDLGFGREMYMRLDNQGVAYYVSNHPTVDDAWSSPGPPLNTVAMEYSPPPGGGSPFIKFYTFDGSGNRIVSVDLDSRGAKLQPELCTPCHGGRTAPLDDGIYPNGGDIGARFVPFDLDSFRYSTANAAYSREAQEEQFRLLNRGVVAGNPGEATLELVRGWYGGPALNGVFDGGFVPPGWRPPLAPDGVAPLYTDVVRRACRGCHVQLDARVPGLGFTTFAQFEGARARITRLVCEEGDMPRAFRTFDKFWLSTDRHQPTALGDFLDGDVAWNAPHGVDEVRAVTVDPTRPAIVYALTLHDVTKTPDGGASWASITNGLPKNDDGALAIVPLELAVDPRAPETLFLAGDGLFRSLDGGGTWAKIRDGFFTDLVAVADAASGTTLLFAVDGGTGEAIESSNGGIDWDLTLTGGVSALAVDPETPTTEYYASASAGLVKRVASGDPSINVNGGVPASGVVDSLAVDPQAPANVYAHFVDAGSTDPAAPRNGTYRSTDHGRTFAFLVPFRVEPDRFRSGTLWGFPQGALARSVDRGLSWQLLLPESAGVSDAAAAEPATLYVATRQGVQRGDKIPCGRKGPGHPVAVASAPRTATTGDPVSLNGTASLPLTGLTWQWSVRSGPAGSSAVLQDATSAVAGFTPDLPGAYLLSLTVRHGDLESTPALVPLVAAPAIPPVSFRNDVVPIFDDDCGNCHTSSNVMDLSGNAASDLAAVLPRVNESDPPASALVRKPRGLDSHPGQLRPGFDLAGDHTRYDLVLRWIEEGANDN